jgi:hypothetical protein
MFTRAHVDIHKLDPNTKITKFTYSLMDGNSLWGCPLPEGVGAAALQLSRRFLASVTALLDNVAVIVSPLRARVLVA